MTPNNFPKCPVCGAAAGAPCRSTDMRHPGELLNAVHRARSQAWA